MEGKVLDEIERRVKWVIDAVLCEKRQYINKHVQNSLNNYFLENYCVLSLKRSLGIMSGRQVKFYILNKYATQMNFPLSGINLEANPPKKYYLLLLGFLEEHYANGSINEYRQQLLNIVRETDSQSTDFIKKRIDDPVEDVLEMIKDSDFVVEGDEQIQLEIQKNSNCREINMIQKNAEQISSIQNGGSSGDEKSQENTQIHNIHLNDLSKISKENEELNTTPSHLRHLENSQGETQPKSKIDFQDQKVPEIIQPLEIPKSIQVSNEIVDSEMRDILQADSSTKKDWVINQWKKMLALFVLHHSYFPDLEAVYEIWYDIFQSRIVEKRKQKKRRPEHIRSFKYEGIPYVIDNGSRIEERKESTVKEKKNLIIEKLIIQSMKQIVPKQLQSSNQNESLNRNEYDYKFKKIEMNEQLLENEKKSQSSNNEQLIQIKMEMKDIGEDTNNFNGNNCKIESQNDNGNIQIYKGTKLQCKEEEIDQFNQIDKHDSEWIDPNNQEGGQYVLKKEQQGYKYYKINNNKKINKILAKEKDRNKKISEEQANKTQKKQHSKAQVNHVQLIQFKDKIVSVKSIELNKDPKSCFFTHSMTIEEKEKSQQQIHQGLPTGIQNELQSAEDQPEQEQSLLKKTISSEKKHQDILQMNPHELAKITYSKQLQQQQQQQQQQQSSSKPNTISTNVKNHQSDQKQDMHHQEQQSNEETSCAPPAKQQQRSDQLQKPIEHQQLNQINQKSQPSPQIVNQSHQLIQQSSNAGQQLHQQQQSQQYPFNPPVPFPLHDPNYPSISPLFVHPHPGQFYPSQYPSLPQQPQYPYYPQPVAAPSFLQQLPYCGQQQQPTGAIQYVPVPYFPQPSPMQFYPQQQASFQFYQQQQLQQQQQQFLAQRQGVQYYPQPFVQYYPPESIQQQPQQSFDFQSQAVQTSNCQQNIIQELNQPQMMLNPQNQAKQENKSSNHVTQQNLAAVPMVGSTSTFQHDSNAPIRNMNHTQNNQDIDNSQSVSPFTTKE